MSLRRNREEVGAVFPLHSLAVNQLKVSLRLALDRQRGIRAAYAQMDGLSPDFTGGYESYWTSALWRPDRVHWVERYTLWWDPRIQLIFMNLHDQPDPPIYSLTNLLYDPTFVAPMVVPDGSALDRFHPAS
jgi:hypothetical protein